VKYAVVLSKEVDEEQRWYKIAWIKTTQARLL
jgi:hypothetical protein